MDKDKLKYNFFVLNISSKGNSLVLEVNSEKEQDEINKLINLLGDDGVSLYKQFLKSKGIQEDKTKPN